MEIQTLMLELLTLIEEFEAAADVGAAVTLWNTRILPILSKISVETGLGRKVAKELAYRMLGFAMTNVATDAELAALSQMLMRKERSAIIRKLMARAMASEWVPVAGQVVTGVCLLAFAHDLYRLGKLPGTMREYQGYIHRYFGYLVKNSVVHDGKVRMPRPALPEEYARRDPNGAWWQC